MKTILFILPIIILLLNSFLFAQEIYPISIPSNLDLNNTFIKNGSTPYLQNEIIEQKRETEINLMEELERELIEIDTFQRCA